MSIPGAASPLFLAKAGETAPFSISRSLRFNSGDSAYLNRTPSSASNRRTWTWSGWVKRSAVGTKQILFGVQGTNDSTYAENYFATDDKLYLRYGYNSVAEVRTTQVFRDVSSWMHIVIVFNVTESAAADKLKLYINGSQVTDFSTDTRSTFLNQDYGINRAGAHKISGEPNGSGSFLDAYLAEINFVDGAALDPTSFGAFDDNGVWQAIDTAGLTFGTNGFRLKFAVNSTDALLGTDSSGNSNTWGVSNLSVAAGAGNDSLVDSPTNGTASSGGDPGGSIVGNYATLNPLQKSSGSTLTNGNLDISMSGAQGTTFATMAFPAAGKWYFECTANSSQGDVGIAKAGADLSQYVGKNSSSYGYYIDGNVYHNDSSAGSGASYGSGDIIGVAFDSDAGTCKWYKNNSLQVTISSLTGEWFPAFGSGNAAGIFNFGSRAFAYTAPSGYKSLNTANLPTPTIADGSQYFNTKLYTGNGSTQTISGLNFSPDFMWFKNRSTNKDPRLTDIIRGTQIELYSSSTSGDYSQSQGVTAFNSDGATVGSDGGYNGSNQGMVLWAWDGGTSTVTNNDGSIASQVRAQPSAGFSIVSFDPGSTTGDQSVGHGLNDAPRLILLKNREDAGNWLVFDSSVCTTVRKLLRLNTTDSLVTESSNVWGGSLPSSTTFGVTVNVSAAQNKDHIAYCFAPVAGYSSMGSYIGNGSATDGPFIHTGFRPAVIITKASSANGTWIIRDTARDTFNSGTSAKLAPNYNYEENNSSYIGFASQTLADFLSNGFKVRSTGGISNDSGVTYIYIAFAENPFQANGGLAR